MKRAGCSNDKAYTRYERCTSQHVLAKLNLRLVCWCAIEYRNRILSNNNNETKIYIKSSTESFKTAGNSAPTERGDWAPHGGTRSRRIINYRTIAFKIQISYIEFHSLKTGHRSFRVRDKATCCPSVLRANFSFYNKLPFELFISVVGQSACSATANDRRRGIFQLEAIH